MTPAALVWFKRDLRVRDHAPLAEAMQFECALGLVVIEPQWLASPECDARQVGFLLDCVAGLQRDLAARGLTLIVRTGTLPQVLQDLRREFPFTHLFSSEETGPGWSYARDLAVADWCRGQGVNWTETPQTGVVRRLRSRTGWAGRWAQRMNAPEAPPATGFKPAPGLQPSAVPTLRQLGLPALSAPLPPGGERAAWATLDSFLGGRGGDYRRAMSSPLTATEGSSRLSAHLAFGTISMRCVHQATEARIAATPDRNLAYALRGFTSRLRWHCHFMQKLEDEPAIEWRNVARSVDGLRPGDGVHPDPIDLERLQAWCEGRTGYPMVDACMRQLRATGWLNFRMRAMLVSIAAYHLWLHWRAGHLGKTQFGAGGDDEVVVVQRLAVGQGQVVGGGVDGGHGLRDEVDALALQQRAHLELDVVAAAPAHRHPGVGRHELEVVHRADNGDFVLCGQQLAHFVGGGHAADVGSHDDDVGHGVSCFEHRAHHSARPPRIPAGRHALMGR